MLATRALTERQVLLQETKGIIMEEIDSFVNRMKSGEVRKDVLPNWRFALPLFESERRLEAVGMDSTAQLRATSKYLAPSNEKVKELLIGELHETFGYYRGAGAYTEWYNVLSIKEREALCKTVFQELGIDSHLRPSLIERFRALISKSVQRVVPTNIPDFYLICEFATFFERGSFFLWYNPLGTS